jgi:hypothetical protein
MSFYYKSLSNSKKRRRKKRRAPEPLWDVINGVRQSEADKATYRSLLESSEAVKLAESEQTKMQQKLSSEFEAFIYNIPYSVSANQLVEFMLNILQHSGMEDISPGAIVRCENIEKREVKGVHSGCATLLFENERMYRIAEKRSSYLVLRGRLIKIKEGNGASKRRSRFSTRNGGASFDASQLQVCLPVDDWTQSPSPVQWTSNPSESVKLEIDPTKRCIVVHVPAVKTADDAFDSSSTVFRDQQMHISFQKICSVGIGQDIATGQIAGWDKEDADERG